MGVFDWLGRRKQKAERQNLQASSAQAYNRGRAAGFATASFYGNSRSGAGGTADKSEGDDIRYPAYYSRQELQTIYERSWAARKFIDIPVDDMLRNWRSFNADDTNEDFIEAEQEFDLHNLIARAIKAGRLYGSGFLVPITMEDRLENPLNLEHLAEGDLQSILIFDGFDAGVIEWERSPYSPNYGNPSYYQFATQSIPLRVHASRVIRFDGLERLTDNPWYHYRSLGLGVPALQPVLLSIFQDTAATKATAHLMQEASIPVIRLANLRDATTSDMANADEQSVDDIVKTINIHKSIFNMLLLSDDDSFERVGVSFSGLSQIQESFLRRLAAAADVPETRFLGRAPGGLNATGASDLLNYATHLKSLQQKLLRKPLKMLDMILAKHLGLAEPPTYTFNPILETSPKEQLEATKSKVHIIVQSIGASILTEDEGRQAIADEPMFEGVDLTGDPYLLEEQEEEQGEQEDGQRAATDQAPRQGR